MMREMIREMVSVEMSASVDCEERYWAKAGGEGMMMMRLLHLPRRGQQPVIADILSLPTLVIVRKMLSLTDADVRRRRAG